VHTKTGKFRDEGGITSSGMNTNFRQSFATSLTS